MRRRNAALAVIAVLALVCLCFSSDAAPPRVPRNLRLEAPDPALPAEVKALAGKWSGSWDNHWDALIFVEKVDKESAQVVFAWGEYNTSRNSCHCGPNWMRVENARIKHSTGKATLSFYSPKIRPHWLKESHTVSGEGNQTFGAKTGSSGRYTYSFVLKTDKPDQMSGEFWSAKNSNLSIKLKRVSE